jgi:peroxiredoxin
MTTKLVSGAPIPALTLSLVGGGEVTLGERQNAANWQVVIVYRGLHCPVCRRYLTRLQELLPAFEAVGAEAVAVSSDPEEKARTMIDEQGLTFPVARDLSVEQMRQLGLYISEPRSADETDRPFAEPATFGINPDGVVQLIDLSNTPFHRADLQEFVETIEWIRQENYPVRGTHV